MSTDDSAIVIRVSRGTLVGTYLSWYIGCFQTGDS